jgi:hypothetical protein
MDDVCRINDEASHNYMRDISASKEVCDVHPGTQPSSFPNLWLRISNQMFHVKHFPGLKKRNV